ncbi:MULTISPECIES: hypothetical protein [unclassified Campylobacter]|uniref:hypothetical protein n=1 Tax=unclassified Campylobacter TaxID=2593542 RepID=UPI0022E9DECE|nr:MULTISPECIES: hypothetical protein [unclassified Campylobacter]MDA3062385.1 hypothetical protein [Campylobacter sp. JMF_14 EL1]MDA3073496.1 hypothetical protein [Campylobacter sp. JMF_10 EL2]MDA3077498.1 hypothetical protein [Campylobacter sp. JMF_06 NA1]
MQTTLALAFLGFLPLLWLISLCFVVFYTIKFARTPNFSDQRAYYKRRIKSALCIFAIILPILFCLTYIFCVFMK